MRALSLQASLIPTLRVLPGSWLTASLGWADLMSLSLVAPRLYDLRMQRHGRSNNFYLKTVTVCKRGWMAGLHVSDKGKRVLSLHPNAVKGALELMGSFGMSGIGHGEFPRFIHPCPSQPEGRANVS